MPTTATGRPIVRGFGFQPFVVARRLEAVRDAHRNLVTGLQVGVLDCTKVPGSLRSSNSGGSQQFLPDQGRENRRYLQLKIPLRAVDVRVDRIIKDLQLDFYWHVSEFDELSNLRTNWKGHLVTP